MFRTEKVMVLSFMGFPRVSGDVPDLHGYGVFRVEFSPRERGCSATRDSEAHTLYVFPA